MTSRDHSPHDAPNIHDVAKAAGVSVGTVSRALNDRAEVAPATRARIAGIAAELGYHPNKLLGALAANRFRKPGLENKVPVALLTRANKSVISPDWIRLFTQTCESWGFAVQILETGNHPDAAALSRQLYYQGVAGLFFYRIVLDDDYWSTFNLAPFSLITLEEALAKRYPGLPLVRHTSFSTIHQAWEVCRARGFRRISAILLDPPGRGPWTMRILASIRYFLSETNEEDRIAPFLVRSLQRSEMEKSKRSVGKWIRRTRPDALILPKAFAANAEEAGCPYLLMNHASGRETGFYHVQERVIERACWLMDLLIRSRQTGLQSFPTQLVVEPEWHEGESLGRSSAVAKE